MDYFDYRAAAHEAGLSQKQLEALAARVREDYPSDEMLFELHMLRACNAIRDGRISFLQAVTTALSA